MPSEQVTAAELEYLETIFWLHEAELPITGANIARAMQLSAPTVHEMIGRLEGDGYVERNDDKTLAFTDAGYEHASKIVRRHRLIERFLTDVLEIPWHECHEEAERLEYGMSPRLEERMLVAVGGARTCPHGHPFVEGERVRGAPLSDVEAGAKITVIRFENEAEDVLHYLFNAGMEVGLDGRVTSTGDDGVTIESGDSTYKVGNDVATTVSVIADPSPPERTAAPPEHLQLSKGRYGR